MVTDPVCGTKVDEKQFVARAVYCGKALYFCSTSCHKTFTMAPQYYLRATTKEPRAAPRTGAGT